MGSGLIYLVIVGMWLAYFLPRWITNHEEISGRSIERFAYTMSLMARTAGNGAGNRKELIRRSQRELANRRAIFASICALTLLFTLMISLGLLAPAIITIPISSLALYIVHARHQITSIKREFEIVKNMSREDVKGDKYSELIVRSRRTVGATSTALEEQWTPLAERITKSGQELHRITILPKGSAERAKTWEPTDIPAPRYQSAPKAAPRRRIDLTRPNLWSEASEANLLEVIAPNADQIFDQQLAEQAAEQIRTSRAVNE